MGPTRKKRVIAPRGTGCITIVTSVDRTGGKRLVTDGDKTKKGYSVPGGRSRRLQAPGLSGAGLGMSAEQLINPFREQAE